MGYEYIQSHRALRQLATRLSNVGFPVLRFDFYGCGDSGGACEQGQLGQWLTDISTAIGAIRRRCGVMKVCLIGLRLGGTLSMIVGAERGDIDGMVLWDPVVSGRAYVKELITWHREMLRYSHVQPKRHITSERPTEILGFPVTEAMLADLENLDPLAIRQKPANNILLIESSEKADEGRCREHLKNVGAVLEYRHLPSPNSWIWAEDISKILVPHQILQSMVSWMSEVLR
jgi:uncharacterized protein